MKHWMKIAGATICLFVAAASTALASDAAVALPAPALPGEEVSHAGRITLRGVLTYIDLEGGFYSVEGYMLRGDDAAFRPHLGKVVIVSGTLYTGPSIQMVKSIDVISFTVDPDQSVSNTGEIPPVLTPVPDYPGFGSISPQRPVPSAISVDGREIAFDQGPAVLDDVLMVPLRFLAEAAGGQVEWDGASRKVIVTIHGRVAAFGIGNGFAEVTADGENPTNIALVKAPVIAEGRTLVSADALGLLGFSERPVSGAPDLPQDIMYLSAPVSGPIEDMRSVLTGVVKEIETGDRVRILVEGGPMSSGEPSLYWVTIFPETKVIVEENGQSVEVSVSTLAEGQTVEVEVEGAIAMSYPALAGAASVLIKK